MIFFNSRYQNISFIKQDPLDFLKTQIQVQF